MLVYQGRATGLSHGASLELEALLNRGDGVRGDMNQQNFLVTRSNEDSSICGSIVLNHTRISFIYCYIMYISYKYYTHYYISFVIHTDPFDDVSHLDF